MIYRFTFLVSLFVNGSFALFCQFALVQYAVFTARGRCFTARRVGLHIWSSAATTPWLRHPTRGSLLRHYPPLIVFAHVHYCLLVLLRVTVLMSLLYYHVIMHFLETLTSEPVWWVIAPAVPGLRAALARCQHRRAPGLWRRSRFGESRHRRFHAAALFDLAAWPPVCRSHARSGSEPRFHNCMSSSHWLRSRFHDVLRSDSLYLIDVTHSLC